MKQKSQKQTRVTDYWFLFALGLAVFIFWLCWPSFGPTRAYLKLAASEPTAEAVRAATRKTIMAPHQSLASVPVGSQKNIPEGTSEMSDFIAKAGQAGDAFGGFNALFTALAFIGIAWAGILQHRQLVEAREAYSAERFELRFFEMLGLVREIMQSIQIRQGSTDERNGGRALESLAKILMKNFAGGNAKLTNSEAEEESVLREMVQKFVTDIYIQYPSAVGPYFRFLFQTFQLIDEAHIDEEEKNQYAKIARGQISEGTVFLLALNGLSRRGKEFAEYINKYGLLEHMHPEYQRYFKRRFLLAYDPLAFAGSEERKEENMLRKSGRSNYVKKDHTIFQEPLDDPTKAPA